MKANHANTGSTANIVIVTTGRATETVIAIVIVDLHGIASDLIKKQGRMAGAL